MFNNNAEPLCIGRHETKGIIYLARDQGTQNFMNNLIGTEWINIVKDPAGISCCCCALSLVDIKLGETWSWQMDSYYCGECYKKEKASILEKIYCVQDKQRKMPHKLAILKSEIETHRHFASLSCIEKMLYEECGLSSTRDNNHYLRTLWSHLYHGKDMPI